MEKMLTAYIAAALWSSQDEAGEPLDSNYTRDDLAPATLASMTEDVTAFLNDHADDIGDNESDAGHDFWLTRNRHGAGFWDGDWADAGQRLTDASHVYGSVDLYVGDDGLVY
jgi:hypothetical protein